MSRNFCVSRNSQPPWMTFSADAPMVRSPGLNYTQYIDPRSPLPNIYGNLKMHGNTRVLRWWLKNDLNNRERPVLWFYGDTAVGKSLLCKLIAGRQQLPIYFTSTGTDPFGEYRGEKIVVLTTCAPRNRSHLIPC